MSAYGHISRRIYVLLSVELVELTAPVDSIASTYSVELVVFTASEGAVSPAAAELLVSIAFAAVLLFLRGGIALRPQAVFVMILAFTLDSLMWSFAILAPSDVLFLQLPETMKRNGHDAFQRCSRRYS